MIATLQVLSDYSDWTTQWTFPFLHKVQGVGGGFPAWTFKELPIFNTQL